MLTSYVLCACSHICSLLLFDISLLLSDHSKMLQAHLSIYVHVCVCVHVCIYLYLYRDMYEYNLYIYIYTQTHTCVCMLSPFSHVWPFVTLWTVACQAPLSTEFSRYEYWSGLPFPSLEDLPDPEIESGSPALQADCLPSELLGKPIICWRRIK